MTKTKKTKKAQPYHKIVDTFLDRFHHRGDNTMDEIAIRLGNAHGTMIEESEDDDGNIISHFKESLFL